MIGRFHRSLMLRFYVARRRLAAISLLGACSRRTPTLHLLVWEGYADPSFQT